MKGEYEWKRNEIMFVSVRERPERNSMTRQQALMESTIRVPTLATIFQTYLPDQHARETNGTAKGLVTTSKLEAITNARLPAVFNWCGRGQQSVFFRSHDAWM